MDLPRAQRIEFLDSIRGLAALSVLFSHAVGVLEAPPIITRVIEFPLTLLFMDGKAAVAMFFVLSGFVLSRPYFKSSAQAAPRTLRVVPFYLKRITRIYFPFFAVLCLSAAASLWLFRRVETIPPQTAWFQTFWSIPWTALDFLKQSFFLLHNSSLQFMVQDWSLGVELKASALLPFLLMAWRRSSWLLALIGVLFITFVGTGYYYLGFISGIFLAAGIEWLTAKVGRWSAAQKCLLLAAGLCLYEARPLLLAVFHSPVKEKWIWTATSAGCWLILVAAFASPRLQKVLHHKSMVFLGRVSYGVYLLQFLVLLVATPWFVRLLNRAGLVSPLPVWLLAFGVSVGLTILVAEIFYRWVEAPSMKLGHTLASRFNPPPQPSSTLATRPAGVARNP